MSEKEKLPVHETVHVIEYKTIYKTNKWWCAVALVNMFGHDKIVIYQWQNANGKWKRKQKFGINFEKDWLAIKSIVDEYINKIKMVGTNVSQ